MDFHPGWMAEKTSAWVQKAASGLSQVGVSPEFMLAPYCTNGSYTGGVMGLPTLIFGPSNVGLAHIIDEYIEVEELLRGARGLAGLAAGFGSGW